MIDEIENGRTIIAAELFADGKMQPGKHIVFMNFFAISHSEMKIRREWKELE